MAGMLPGVECARRRRFHQSGGSSDSPGARAYGWTRRPSFCLYTSNHEKANHINSTSLMKQRSISIQVYQDDQKLGVQAREAKERLDERLRAQRKSEPKRENGKSVMKGDQLQVVVYGTSKSGSRSRRFSWTKLSWKASEQEECAICLEGFRSGETLVHPPCAHRFHHGCLVPWLENNSHCPCCRTACCRTGINVMTQI